MTNYLKSLLSKLKKSIKKIKDKYPYNDLTLYTICTQVNNINNQCKRID